MPAGCPSALLRGVAARVLWGLRPLFAVNPHDRSGFEEGWVATDPAHLQHTWAVPSHLLFSRNSVCTPDSGSVPVPGVISKRAERFGASDHAEPIAREEGGITLRDDHLPLAVDRRD